MDLSIVKKVTESQLRNDLPDMRPGAKVRVYVRIKEGDKTRIQMYEGVIVAMRGTGVSQNITVRRVSSGVGVQRTFPVNSPIIEKIELVSYGKVRRAKLNYLKGRSGKASRIAEKIRQK